MLGRKSIHALFIDESFVEHDSSIRHEQQLNTDSIEALSCCSPSSSSTSRALTPSSFASLAYGSNARAIASTKNTKVFCAGHKQQELLIYRRCECLSKLHGPVWFMIQQWLTSLLPCSGSSAAVAKEFSMTFSSFH